MRWRSLGLLAFTLAVVAGGYVALESRAQRSEDRTRRVFQADENDVERMVIERRAEQIVMRRDGEGWRLIEPVRATADTHEVNSLLHAVLTAAPERTVDERPTDIGQYGLHQPAARVTLTLKGETSLPSLLLGDKNPNGFSVYAKRDDQPNVFLLNQFLRDRLHRGAADLRDRRILVLNPDHVSQVTLIGKAGRITLKREGANGWELIEPMKTVADADQVRQLLWKVKDARAKDFLSGGRDAKRRVGLDRPDMVVELIESDISKRLLLKKAPDRGVGLYALVEPGEGVVSTDARLLSDLSRSPAELRDRHLLRFDVANVNGVTLQRGEHTIVLVKEKDTWRITAPIDAEANAGAIYDLLHTLKDLRYLDIAQEGARNVGRYGLRTPHAVVTLSSPDGTPIPTLFIGATEQSRLYARLATGHTVYAIDPRLLDRIPADPAGLRLEAGTSPAR
jgi:hypothetical protein